MAASILLGCETVQIAKDVELVVLSPDRSAGTSTGALSAQHCGVKIFDIGTGSNMVRALSQVEARYIRHMNATYIYRDYWVWSRDCWKVTGEGYQ